MQQRQHDQQAAEAAGQAELLVLVRQHAVAQLPPGGQLAVPGLGGRVRLGGDVVKEPATVVPGRVLQLQQAVHRVAEVGHVGQPVQRGDLRPPP